MGSSRRNTGPDFDRLDMDAAGALVTSFYTGGASSSCGFRASRGGGGVG